MRDNMECNLCGIIFTDDFENRMKRHERFHKNCKTEGRNTTEGVVKWINDDDDWCSFCGKMTDKDDDGDRYYYLCPDMNCDFWRQSLG